MKVLTAFVPAWLGEEEYREAWLKQFHNRGFQFRFWGRLVLASAGLCFFLWQQIAEPGQWWGSDGFGVFALALTVSQAAGPLFYVLHKVTERVFLTKNYLEALQEGRFYASWKSICGTVLMAILSFLAASGLLGSHWYMRPLVFLLTIPVVCFWLIFPAYNWAAGRVRGNHSR